MRGYFARLEKRHFRYGRSQNGRDDHRSAQRIGGIGIQVLVYGDCEIDQDICIGQSYDLRQYSAKGGSTLYRVWHLENNLLIL